MKYAPPLQLLHTTYRPASACGPFALQASKSNRSGALAPESDDAWPPHPWFLLGLEGDSLNPFRFT